MSSNNLAGQACPCLQRCLSGIDRRWSNLIKYCKKRRNSHKRVLYFSAQCALSFFVGLTALIGYAVLDGNVEWQLANVCTSSILTGAALGVWTIDNNIAFMCPEDYGFGLATCELGDMMSTLSIMFANLWVCLLQFLCTGFLVFCFKKFVDMPVEKLQFDKGATSGCSGRWLLFCSGFCKQGPWLIRLLHFSQVIFLLGSWIMMFLGYCYGDMRLTNKCLAYDKDCGYNQIRNCQYYYSYCEDVFNTTKLRYCFVQEDTSASGGERKDRLYFSGKVDVRLVHEQSCVRCGILQADVVSPATDEFYLLDDNSSTATPEWRCLKEGRCFYAADSVWENICSRCAAEDPPVVLTSDFSYTCASGRRLQGTENASENSSENSSPAPSENASENSSAAPSENASLDPSPAPLPSPSPGIPAPTPPSSVSVVNKQMCEGFPNKSSYFTDEEHCAQAGSIVYSTALIYVYFAGTSWIVLTVVGQVIRFLFAIEPWFFMPVTADEGYFWKFLRLQGP